MNDTDNEGRRTHNQKIRLENNRRHETKVGLIALRSHTLPGNAEIPNFPESVAELDARGVRDLNILLEHLGLPSAGRNADEKRRAIKRAIGVYVTIESVGRPV